MNENPRSDLACESPETLRPQESDIRRRILGDIRIEEIRAAQDGRQAVPHCATIHCPNIWEMDRRTLLRTADTAAGLLSSFLAEAESDAGGRKHRVLVTGLGNRFLTADSLGPRTADLVTVTNHAAEGETLPALLGCRLVSAFSPGVPGQTGMEAAELIRRAADAAQAEIIITVDALCARSTERLGTTVQITDAGIRPGSGVGGHSLPITRESMGIPVIALGIPTVVASASLVLDVLHEAGIKEGELPLNTILEKRSGYTVSPRECDLIVSASARLLSRVLNRALTPELL